MNVDSGSSEAQTIMRLTYDGTQLDQITYADTIDSAIDGRGNWILVAVSYYTESTSTQFKRIVRSRYRSGATSAGLNGAATDVAGFALPAVSPIA